MLMLMDDMVMLLRGVFMLLSQNVDGDGSYVDAAARSVYVAE